MALAGNGIKKITAKQILDSNARPTVQAELKTDFGKFLASVPSGVSTGKYEAVELRDRDGSVKKAVENIEKIIAPALAGKKLESQLEIDKILFNLDGTKNKSRLGANAILAVSIACCRAIASAQKMPLWQYISQIQNIKYKIPAPSFNVIEGGRHGQSELAFQEFMVIPQKEKFSENLKIGKKIYKSLKKVLNNKFGKKNIKLSKEGAFSPPIKKVSEALDLILEAAKKAREKDSIKIGIDAAASEFYQDRGYKIDGQFLSQKELVDFYLDLARKYPIVFIEDPFSEDDFDGWKTFRVKISNLKSGFFILGDDLTATNLERIKMARQKKLCNGVIIKPNQIGTVTETVEAAKITKSFGWKIMVANRAGETKDDFIADLAVGVGADFIKSGAPYPKERLAKYNRLIKIEKEIG